MCRDAAELRTKAWFCIHFWRSIEANFARRKPGFNVARMTGSATRKTIRLGLGIVGRGRLILIGFPLPPANEGLLEMLTSAIVDGAIDLAVKEA